MVTCMQRHKKLGGRVLAIDSVCCRGCNTQARSKIGYYIQPKKESNHLSWFVKMITKKIKSLSKLLFSKLLTMLYQGVLGMLWNLIMRKEPFPSRSSC